MNAITYIQQHGVEKARKLAFDPLHPQMTHVTDDGRHWLNKDNPHCHATADDLKDMIVLTELKRIIESVDLIKAIGGIEIAKRKVNMADFNEFLLISFQAKDGLASVYIQKAQQAIADYEAIGGEHV